MRQLTLPILLLSSLASAQEQKPPPPSVTLPAGKLNATLTLEVNATNGAFGKPTSIAPDVSYGLSRDLTLAFVSSTYATTGFRGSAGLGLCVTGTSDGCLKAWNNLGVEAFYSLSRGPVAVAADLGVHGVNLDAGWWAVKIGARSRFALGGPLALYFTPSVFVALDDRSATVKQKDTLWLPLLLTAKLSALTVGVSTGLKSPLEGFGDAWTVPVGAVATYAIDKRMTVGASWVFGKLGSASKVADPKGLDQRALQAWFSVTF